MTCFRFGSYNRNPKKNNTFHQKQHAKPRSSQRLLHAEKTKEQAQTSAIKTRRGKHFKTRTFRINIRFHIVVEKRGGPARAPFAVPEVRRTVRSVAGLPHYLVRFPLGASTLIKLASGKIASSNRSSLLKRKSGRGFTEWSCISAVNKHRADYEVLSVTSRWHSELTVCTQRSQGVGGYVKQAPGQVEPLVLIAYVN